MPFMLLRMSIMLILVLGAAAVFCFVTPAESILTCTPLRRHHDQFHNIGHHFLNIWAIHTRRHHEFAPATFTTTNDAFSKSWEVGCAPNLNNQRNALGPRRF